MSSWWNLLWYITIYLLQVSSGRDIKDTRRPIWNVAHMVNALYQVDYYLDEGANSLEFDIAFDWEGNAKYTFHGIPCDCFRRCTRYEHIVTYLDHIRKITTPGDPQFRKEFVLLFMDLKVQGLKEQAMIHAGEDLAMKLLDYYWLRGKSGGNAFILVSLPSIVHVNFVNSFRQKLISENFTSYDTKIGFDFSGNENLDKIRNAYESSNIDQRIWQGDGITNCLPRRTTRLKDALYRRDQPGTSYINKVYWWTVDKMSTMRTVLRLGVDGMITNYPDRLVSVLNEPEFANRFRLATHEDNPWDTHPFDVMYMVKSPRERNSTGLEDEEDELLYNC